MWLYIATSYNPEEILLFFLHEHFTQGTVLCNFSPFLKWFFYYTDDLFLNLFVLLKFIVTTINIYSDELNQGTTQSWSTPMIHHSVKKTRKYLWKHPAVFLLIDLVWTEQTNYQYSDDWKLYGHNNNLFFLNFLWLIQMKELFDLDGGSSINFTYLKFYDICFNIKKHSTLNEKNFFHYL